MRLNKSVVFVLMIIFLLSLNFIVAKDVNKTNLNADSFEIDNEDSISNSYDTNLQKLNQNNIVKADEILEKSDNTPNRILEEDSNSSGWLGDGVNLKHLYVSPDGNGSGLDENNPRDFITTLKNLEDNTVIHMLNGNYTLSGITPNDHKFFNIISKNITVIGNNPDNVIIISNLTGGNVDAIFNFYNNENIKFENITHRRSEERRVGKECRSRWSPYH